MHFFKTAWGLLFRLFPCPTKTGLRRIGNPGPESPVLITCNFDLTVKRLNRMLRGLDVWLLVGESKGVNVWCAACGEEFNTHSVVSVVKTSGIADKVNHRTLILPPLGAPGIKGDEVQSQTGWKVKWGPVHTADIPRYINGRLKKDDTMKRARYDLKERLDTAIGTMFPFYLLGGIGFLVFGRNLLADYLVVGVIVFVVLLSLCPWIPVKAGFMKAVFLEVIVGVVFIAMEVFFGANGNPIRPSLIIAMVLIAVFGLDLGGASSTMRADIEPLLARFGVKAIGNIALAGSIRTELLNGYRELSYDRELCKGCRSCEELCPQGVWDIDESKRAVLARKEDCTACLACLVQCESGAIQAPRVERMAA
jgi:NAD-dependent dihydropyrimidine dehydrogenase PreA subunit